MYYSKNTNITQKTLELLKKLRYYSKNTKNNLFKNKEMK